MLILMYNNKEGSTNIHMSLPPKTTARRLTDVEINAILQSEESFARYLATLTLDQVHEYGVILETMPLDEAPKKALKAVLRLAEQEAEKNLKRLQAHALEEKNLLLCLKLSEQLKELEDIQRSLSHDE